MLLCAANVNNVGKFQDVLMVREGHDLDFLERDGADTCAKELPCTQGETFPLYRAKVGTF